MKEKEISYKTRTCTKCNGSGEQTLLPPVNVDQFGNEFPFPEYTLYGVFNTKILPNNAMGLRVKKENCSRCNGYRKEHFIN